MAIRINVRNLNKKIKIDRNRIKRITGILLKKEFGKKNADLGILFVDNARIKKLNYNFTGRKKATDVLTFTYDKEFAEIIVSSDQARVNARAFRTSLKEELVLYVIHGLLHYLGYDDSTARKKERMRKKERKLLGKLWKSVPLSTA